MDIANLGITVNSAQLLLAAERMDKVGGAAKSVENRLYGFNNSTKQTETALTRVADRADGATKAFSGFKNVLQVAGIGLAAKELADMADVWSDLRSRLNLATGGIQEGADVMVRLQKVARTTYSELTTTVDSFIANSRALKELGYNTQQQLDYTEALNNALVVSSIKGEQAASVQMALSKAMSLGKLSGNELHTVIASGGRVAELLADQLGVTVTQLTKLGADGKITGDIINTALIGNLEKLREDAESMPATIGDAFVLMKNSVLSFVGATDQSYGITNRLAEGIIFLSDHVETLGTALIALGGFSAMKMFVPYITKAAQAAKSTLEFNKSILLGNSAVLEGRTAIAIRAKAAHDLALADKEAAVAALQAAQADRARAVAALEAAKAGQLAGVTRAQAAAQLVTANKAVNAASLTMAAQSKTTAQTLGVMNVAMKNASFSARAMSIAMGGLSFLGGPLGVAILGVGTALYMQSERAEKASQATRKLQEEWKAAGIIADEFAKKTNETLDTVSQENASRRLLQLKDLQKQYLGTNILNLAGYGDNLKALESQGKYLRQALPVFSFSEESKQIKFDNSSIEQALSLVNDLRSGKITVDQYLADLKEIQKTNVSQPIYDWISALGEAGGVVKGFKTEMLSLGYTPELDNMLGKLDEIKQTFLDLQDSGKIGIAGPEGKKQIEDLFSEVSKGGQEAVIAKDKLRELLGGSVYGGHLLSKLNEVSSEIGRIISQTNELMGKANELSGKRYLNSLADAAKPVTDKIMQGVDLYTQYQAGEEYVKTLEQQNQKTKTQVDYEKRLAALREINPNLTPEQEKRAVNSEIERDKRWKDEEKVRRGGGSDKGLERDANAYRDLVKSANDRIEQINQEVQLVGKSGIAADTMRMKLELLQHAQDKGRTITAAQADEIDKLSKKYEQAATAAAKAKLSADLYTDRVRMGLATVEQGVYDKMEQYGIPYGSDPQIAAAIRYNSVLEMGIGYAQSFANTLTSGLVNGTKFTESLGTAFKNLGNQILSMATNDIISGLFRNLLGGGGSGGGWLSSLLGGFFGGSSGGFPAAPSGGLYANGGAFGTGSQRFAKGGTFTNSIVSSPTPFRFADGGGFSNGVMGEAGPEAILPLKRDAQGRLGVSQHGAGSNQGGGTQTSVNVDVKASKYFDVIVQQKAQEVSQQSIKQFAQSPQLKQVAEQVTRGVLKAPSKRY